MATPPPAAPQVLCLGEALVDRLGPPGGEPAAATSDDRLGGAPANVACALARLGTPAAFLGRLGSDAIGEAFARLFASRGVDTTGLQRDTERPSRIVLVRRDAAGERQFGGFAGERGTGFADQALDAPQLEAAIDGLTPSARWLLTGTIPLASPAAAAAQELALARAASAGVAVAVDVNWRPTFWNPAADPASGPDAQQLCRCQPLLERAALIKCAREEALWLCGSDDPALLSASLPGRPAVVVSDGANPVRWCWGEATGELAPFPVAAVDTTGAGDAFSAGLLHGLCARPELLGGGDEPGLGELMRFASACGALVCQGAGAIDPQPTAAEVQAWLSRAR
ncbi:carbohydrate kinase [Cyanobium sp. ATX 6A2]|uniref:carbohydrate kinase family protein n=1 Tax=Cyanobium sp. ATX 6A2 TaxID=2823700 RepID=UPI0020CDB5FF|nr:carbohydrate kinase [Cyanobium sp. ATX 6A2]MCP9887024.1 carbohydrate kinase [Cyanobium sp. ATX 6A2]